jgi:hypothetical protein
MSLSDGIKKLIGRKGTKEQRKREETKKRLERLDRVKTFEEQLQEAILLQQQLDYQDSLMNAQKKQHK